MNGTSLAPSSNSTEGGSAHRAFGDVSSLARIVSIALLFSVVPLL